jgi:hypothetical protein
MAFSFPETFPGPTGTLLAAPGSPPGPGGSGGAPSPAPGSGWEIYVRSAADYTTLLAIVPYKTWTGFTFAKQLNDLGSGSVTLNMDDPFWKSTLPDGHAAFELLDAECLWQFYQDGVPRMEFLAETITEQLIDPSEQRIVTVTGPGTAATLKWGMAAPSGFPDIVLKMDGIFDSFDEVDISGNPVLDTNLWNVLSPAGQAFPTPISPIFNYPGGAGYALNQLFPSGTLTINATSGGTVLGATPYDATDTLISAQVTPVGSQGNATDSNGNPVRYGTNLNGSEVTQFYVESLKNPSFYAMIGLSSGTFYAQLRGTSGLYTKNLPAYDPSNHAYWMITEQGGSGGGNGTFYFWTSPDGSAWTLQWQQVHDWDATYCGFYCAATYSVTGQVMVLSNLNSLVTTPSYQGNLYLGQPMMGIWYDLLLAAQARGTIGFVSSSMGPAVDSFGRSWTDTQNVQVANGTDLFTLLQNGCAAVNADFCMQPGFVLQVGLTEQGSISLGTDRSGTIILREGRDFLTKGRVRTRSTLQNLLGAENSDGHEISASNGSSIAQWGQREGWFQLAAQVDPTSMAIATAAAVADTALETLSYTGTLTPNVAGKTVFQSFDVGDWLGLERPDFSAVDAVRVVAIAVSVDQTGLEADELTFETYVAWLEQQLTYVANKLGGAFVNIPGTSPVAPSKYGTGQVPTWFAPAQTLSGLADVVGSGGAHAAPLVYNPATGQWQAGGSPDPVTGTPMGISLTGAAIAPDGGGTPIAVNGSITAVPGVGVTVTNPATGASVTTGVQPDGTTTTTVANALPPAAPATPTVVGGPGTLGVAWNGLLGGTGPLSDFLWTEVHVSTTNGFTPSPATLAGTLSAGGIYAVSGLTGGTTYYAKLMARNQSGIAGTASPQASGVPLTGGANNAPVISGTAPVSPRTGDLWFDSSNGYELKQWSGSAWVAFQYGTNAISAGAITAAQIAANTITAAQIAAGTVTAAQISANTITAAQLAAGIIYAGIVNGTTITGALIETAASNPSVQMDGGRDSIFGYDGSSNLLFALAGAAGTDFFSHAYPQGLFSQQLTLNNQSSAPPSFSGASVFYSSVAGRPRYEAATGDDSVLERSTVNVAQFPIGNTATRTIISAPLGYQAGEGSQSSEYEIEIDGIISTGTTTTPTLTFDLGVDGSALGASFPIGGTYLTANGSFAYSITFRLAVLTSGAGGTALLASAGTVINRSGTALGNAGTWLSVGASSADLTKAFDTTSAHTLQAYAKWASTNSGQSVVTYRTKLLRRM